MNLVDRLIEVQGWPTSRKFVLISALTFIQSVFNVAVFNLFLGAEPWFDVAYVNWFGGGIALLMLLTAAIAWELDRRGREGRWLLYATSVPFTLLLGAIIWGLGPMSTALIVFIPLTVVNVGVLFDDVIGRHLALASLGSVLVLVGLSLTDWLPYAPALHDANLDHLASPRFVLALGITTTFCAASIFVLVLGEVSAARRFSARLDAAQKLIARYVPREVADDILEGRMSHEEGHHRRRLTIVFSDLVGFSDLAEELEPEDLALVLNEYFSEMLTIAHRHNGTVDELLGDALLVLFGAPRATTDKEHALNSVRMAAEMHLALARLNDRWRDAGITEPLAVRIGINTGVVTVGNFGSPERLTYTALGKHVNLAARLQAIAEPGTTVLSYATYLLVNDEFQCSSLGPKTLKGIVKPVEAYAVHA